MKRKKRIGTVGKAIGCLFFLMVSLFPIYWLVAMAIRPTDEMRGHIALIPQSLTGIHFAELFSAKNFGTAIINSLQTTFGSLFVSLVVGICAAYIIARRRFRFGLKKPMTYWVLLVRVLPLVAPGIAAVAMLSFMYAWNEYTYTVIFTRTAVNNTVPLALALLNTEDNLTNFGLVAAGGVVSVIPITLFVIFAQNYLISGLSSGAVKE